MMKDVVASETSTMFNYHDVVFAENGRVNLSNVLANSFKSWVSPYVSCNMIIRTLGGCLLSLFNTLIFRQICVEARFNVSFENGKSRGRHLLLLTRL